ncbi:uncharacterized protein F5Z01DRAFT_644671 [Emericellopsis atlantica]|uniref:Uncharacterized protein n=1 Tax=Emericellopsis atlantica TaxID=2614577 RepID=A0A9P7ZT98_9HYPO|nr:uncharacterized protein F5Z01DRAFT_644671 [Emericellopsis atlantica]KAG9257948.1 hypothetical protein F5Z01DRAFT_644671 [Emericellopsis atlantica]
MMQRPMCPAPSHSSALVIYMFVALARFVLMALIESFIQLICWEKQLMARRAIPACASSLLVRYYHTLLRRTTPYSQCMCFVSQRTDSYSSPLIEQR